MRGESMMETKKLVQSALFVAAGIILPIFFHFSGLGGPAFLPMHIPVLLAGLLLSWREGLIVGILTPLLSSLMTGMPPMVRLPLMTLELALYGFAGGLLYNRLRFKLYPSLVGAMVAGRLGFGLGLLLLGEILGIKVSPLDYLVAATLTGIPGIIVQLLVIPILIRYLKANGYFTGKK